MKLIMAADLGRHRARRGDDRDEKLCDKVKVSGLGVPSEMLATP